MQRILIIEKSTTLRLALTRQFPDDAFEVHGVATYEEALSRLRDSAEYFDAVVLGWPSRTASITDELLVLLEQPTYRHVAVIVLSEDSDPSQLNWLTQRPGTALLMWEEHGEIKEALNAVQRKLPAADNTDSMMPGDNDHRRGIHILLVDDSPTARLTYSSLLSENGYTVQTAASVDEGYQRASEDSFDIAIIDYFMPGDTGDVLCRRLRENSRTRDMVMSILTGTYLDQVIADSLAAGAVECMFKNEANELFLARVAAMSRAVRTRRSVERERRHLEGILNSVGDGVYGVDNEGKLAFMNPAAQNILGFAPGSRLTGKDPRTLFHMATAQGEEGARDEDFLVRAYATGERIDDWQTVFRARDGRKLPVEGTVYPLTIDGRRQGSVVAFRDVTERQLLEDQLRWQANHDALTKLPNRHYFEEQLQRECQRVSRSGRTSALIYIDLDQFKYINDTAGHRAGDQVLLEVGQRLTNRLRSSDTLARLGGDEFAIVLHDLDPTRIPEVADAYRNIVGDTHFTYEGKQYKITASVGAAAIDSTADAPGEAMAHADLAAHIAKGQGRNQTHTFKPDDGERKAMDRELGWSTRLNQALANDEFELVFQPVVPAGIEPELLAERDLRARWEQVHQGLDPGRDWQYEVLIRLRDGSGEWILPGAFLPAAARFSLMPAIDRWAIGRSLKLLAEAQAMDRDVPSLAINLSGEALTDANLAADIVALLEQHGIDGRRLSFEITETTAITNLTAAQSLIADLAAVGCRFALDDFGSGFCSFGHLKHLPVDYIKIDGQFIQGLVNDPLDKEIVLAINQIAHSLGKRTVAEFVETPEILAVVRECGIDFVQGHCVAPAMAIADIDELNGTALAHD